MNLDLNHVIISSSGLVALFEAALHSGVMKSLDVDGMDLDEIALTALATLMKRSKSITEYYLQSIGNGKNAVGVICDALVDNDVLELLFLESSDIGLDGARILGRFLKACKSKVFAYLSLSMNRLGDEGVTALVDGLKNNASLRTLNLVRCGISDDGAVALASLLENGSPLETLYLFGNDIKETGMRALVNALERNHNVHTLSLACNPGLGRERVENDLLRALERNVSLIHLYGGKSSKIAALLTRNQWEIPAAVRSAALLLIGIRRSTDFDGMGDFAVFPKDIVKLIAQAVWATRRDPIWIQALK